MKRKILIQLLAPLFMLPFYAEGDGTGGSGASTETTPATTTTTVASVADVQAEIAKALAAEQAKNAQEFKAATGFDTLKEYNEAKLKEQGKHEEIATTAKAEAAQYKVKFESTAIKNALLAASTEAIDPDIITELLSHKASVDVTGNVTIDGKPAKEAVADFLKTKPHLAKPTGNTGSGSQSSSTPLAAEQQVEQAYITAAKNGDVMGMLAINTGAKK